MGPAGEPIEAVFREERGRLLALLAARFGDLDLAEEVAAEALLAAVETWPRSGVSREPLAWLATTARRKALDRIRRDATLATKLATLHADADPARRTEPVPEHEHIPDDRLQLMFACCHPALDLDTQTGLTLRYCCPALKMPRAYFGGDERPQRRCLGAADDREPRSAEATAATRGPLDGAGDQHLAVGSTAALAGLTPPMNVSSTSMSPDSLSRPGTTITSR